MNERIQAVEAAVATILAKPKYRHVHTGLVRMLVERELANGRPPKQVVKAVSAKLHQVAGAYFARAPQFDDWAERLMRLPRDVGHPDVRALCSQMMAAHSSTTERLPILEEFFHAVLASIAPLESVLDLACGLNPLALAWMPLTPRTRYYGCDVYSDMAVFLNRFFSHIDRPGHFEAANLLDLAQAAPPLQAAQVTLLLKSLPCLEQLRKGVGLRLLEIAPSPYVLVSFPVSSLGGRPKGMRRNYEEQFLRLVEGSQWSVERFSFRSELAFLVNKHA